ncbi:MAG: flagellar protein FlaG [Clostridia bacterium]|nr:flagellar protein FlaG [Clostridia bacterium]
MEIRERVSSITSISSISNINTLKNVVFKEKDFNNNNNIVNKEREPETAFKQISKEETLEGVEILNDTMELYNHKLHFEVHEDTKRLKVAIVDKETEEIIKEIPPEELLDMLAKIQDIIGILIDKKI